jgi:hypothetical protein
MTRIADGELEELWAALDTKDGEIVRLRAENERLREALQNIAYRAPGPRSIEMEMAFQVLAAAPAPSTMEHIARDIRAGIFPNKSPSREE